MADLSKFSLQSIWLDTTNTGSTGGTFKLYGYANAINNGLLTSTGSPNPTDPEGGTIAPIASYSIANDGIFASNVTLSQLLTQDANWGNVGAVWLTMEGFNHSPTTNYTAGSYSDWDIRIDDITLAAPTAVPLPNSIFLLFSGLVCLYRSNLAKQLQKLFV